MAKKPAVKAVKKQAKVQMHEHDFEEDYDFPDIMDACYEDHDSINGMVDTVIEASNHQMVLALELTKLITEKAAAKPTEDNILATFKKASKTVAESFPLKALWEQLAQ